MESNRIEFKSGWNPVSIYHSICAFANDYDNIGGGYILVGVEENNGIAVRPVKGIHEEQLDKIQREITAKLKKPVFYIRYDTSSIEAKGEQLDELRDMANRVPFDDRGNPDITLRDISPLLVKDYLVKVDSKLQYEDLVNHLEQVLDQMDLYEGPTEKKYLKNVAAMMFCETPEKFFRTTQVDIVVFPDGRETNPDNIIEPPVIKGSIPMMIRDAMSYLRTNVVKERIKKLPDDERSLRYFNYPYQALEDAVANACYHRDYREREPIEITIEPDKISILSHGGPDRSIPMDVIKRAQTLRCRKYRNRRLGEFLKELGLTEGRATGIPTIQKKLRENGSAAATIETNEERSFFLIDIPCHPDFVGDDLSQVVSQVVSQVKGADLAQVVEVFISLQKAMSMAELMQMFRQVNRTRFKRICLDILIKTGLATPTVPDKPNSRFQKYVLTEKGKSIIETVNKQKEPRPNSFQKDI